ncbi:unnamed protein product [Schistosoma margrebowiei]|uniref:Uncharacterized protein n=1 Tax=Schistosoma margrebowiei TaxID=48269 RepID=A0A3P7VKV0_9TREM|nr:unnamed protein product [Schistosoma margrebowiei]
MQMYQEGMALVRLVNNLNDSQPVFYHQSGLQHTVHRLDADFTFNLMDSIEEFKVNNTKAYLVSFMWNMQRVLLFTQNASVAKNARLSSDLEPIDQEIVISLQSIGISLVDNHSRAELAYISITRLVSALTFIDFLCFYQLLVSSHKLIPRCNLSNTCTHMHTQLSIQNLV